MAEVSDLLTGKITRVLAYGAFVALDGGGTGFVHVSEISAGFVKNVSDFLYQGMDVKTLLIGEDHDGRKRLSIKKADAILHEAGLETNLNPSAGAEAAARKAKTEAAREPKKARRQTAGFNAELPPPMYDELRTEAGDRFEDKLARFLKDSTERQVDIKHRTENKRGDGYVRRG